MGDDPRRRPVRVRHQLCTSRNSSKMPRNRWLRPRMAPTRRRARASMLRVSSLASGGHLPTKRTTQASSKSRGVDDSNDVKFYLGKRIMYMYRTKTEKDGTRFRVMWGKVCAPHGTSGVVRAKFTKNLPPSAIGAP